MDHTYRTADFTGVAIGLPLHPQCEVIKLKVRVRGLGANATTGHFDECYDPRLAEFGMSREQFRAVMTEFWELNYDDDYCMTACCIGQYAAEDEELNKFRDYCEMMTLLQSDYGFHYTYLSRDSSLLIKVLQFARTPAVANYANSVDLS